MMSFLFRILKVLTISIILTFVRILRPQIKSIYRGTTQALLEPFHTLHSMCLDVTEQPMIIVVPTMITINLCQT